MITFQEFMFLAEATYDKDVMGSSQIRRTGEGGRVDPRTRKKSAPEKRRMAQAKPGEERKPSEYKPRKDIGTQKSRSEREQQPAQERGSADVKAKAAAAAKAERVAAARARAAAKKSGSSASASKTSSKEAEKTATKLLATKKASVDKRPADQPKRATVGMSRAERKDITRRGHRFAQELAKQGEAERRGLKPHQIKLKNLTDAK